MLTDLTGVDGTALLVHVWTAIVGVAVFVDDVDGAPYLVLPST